MLRRTMTRCNAFDARLPIFANKGCFGVCFLENNHTGVVETFGKYTRTVKAGLNFYIPFFQRIKSVSNRMAQQTYTFEAKTKDNIFAVLTVAAHVKIDAENTVDALYKMDNPIAQIHAFLDSEIRAQVSRRNLDQLYEEQQEIVQTIFETPPVDPRHPDRPKPLSVKEKVEGNGFKILNVLIRNIDPPAKVKDAMNTINASLRMRDAAKNEADAKYITAVREAEADRDRKRLQGEGISQQRLAIMKGYEEGIDAMSSKFGLSPKEIVDFVVKSQHLDTLQSIAKSHNCKTLFMDHNPNSSTSDSDFMKKMLGAHEGSDLSHTVKNDSSK